MIKLNARSLLNEGWALVTQNFWQVVSIAFLPILVGVGLDFFPLSQYLSHPYGLFTEHLISLYLAIFFAVCWMKFAVTGVRHKGITMLRLGKSEFKFFFGYFFLWDFALIVLSLVIASRYGTKSLLLLNATEFRDLWEFLGWTALAIPFYYALSLRFFLLFPAIACGEPSSIKQSWEATKGHWGLLVRSLLMFWVCYLVIVHGVHGTFGLMFQGWGFLSNPLENATFMLFDGQWGTLWGWFVYVLNILIDYCLWAWFMSIPALLYKKFLYKK